MGIYTQELNLYKTNMLTDGNDTFDFDRDLNENFDKIDTFAGKINANIVTNIAELKSSQKIDNGKIVSTKGYYTAGDGGHGFYIIRTKTNEDVEDSGKIHFLQNNLVAELLLENNVANIRQFGAKGDGITDDSNAFKSAKTTGNIIFFPVGTYLIDSSELEIIKKGQSIYGENCQNTIIKINGNDGLVLNGSASPAYRSKQTISNLTITRDTKTSGSIGIKGYKNAEIIVDNLIIKNFETGLYLEGCLISSFNNVAITQCDNGLVMRDNSSGLNCNLNQFRNCRIYGVYRQAVSNTGTSNGILFDSCEFEDCGTGFKINNATSVGDNTAILSSIENLKVGDTVALSINTSAEYETATIQSIDSDNNIITFTTSLTKAHSAEENGVLFLPICNIQCQSSGNCTFLNCWFEANRGKTDITFNPNNSGTWGSGNNLIGCKFLSTAVYDNIYADNCPLYTFGCGGIVTQILGSNLHTGSACMGMSLSRFASINSERETYLGYTYNISTGGFNNRLQVEQGKTDLARIYLDAVHHIDLGRQSNRWYLQSYLQYNCLFSQGLELYGDGSLTYKPLIIAGSGSPEGEKTAPMGSIYLNVAGGANTTLYVKATGTGNTGWVAK